MRKFLSPFILTAVGVATSASAYQVSSGIDLLAVGGTPPTTPTKSIAAEAAFFTNIAKAGFSQSATETFENQKGIAPLTLDFKSLGTAALNGAGQVLSTGDTLPNGDNPLADFNQYGLNSSKYWSAVAKPTSTDPTTFSIVFGQAIAGFGFYGIDIGDAEGTLQIELYRNKSLVSTQDVPAPIPGRADGNTLYFGLLAQSDQELFDGVRFVFQSRLGSTDDTFAFDNFTIAGAPDTRPPGTIPEPASLALAGLALLGLRASRRRA